MMAQRDQVRVSETLVHDTREWFIIRVIRCITGDILFQRVATTPSESLHVQQEAIKFALENLYEVVE